MSRSTADCARAGGCGGALACWLRWVLPWLAPGWCLLGRNWGVPVAGSMLEFCSGFHCRIGGIRGDPAGGILLDPPDSHWPGDPPRRCRFNSPRQPAQQLLWASLPRLPDSPGCCCTCSRTCRALATSCAVAVALQLAPSGAKVGVWRTTPVGYDVTALAPSGALSCASCAALP
jgi:hypothetical protein